jgi:hypothetical protein
MNKPKFDPTAPFEVASSEEKPKFDPTAPFQPVEASQSQPQQDPVNLKDAAIDTANKTLQQIPEAVGSGIGYNLAGPVGSGVGSVIGKSASDLASGINSAIQDPNKFIEDLQRLPTKEQVLDQLGKYANTFSLNTLMPALVNKFFAGAEKVPGNLQDSAENLAENATGATRVQAEKFRPGSGRELLDIKIVSFGDTQG